MPTKKKRSILSSRIAGLLVASVVTMALSGQTAPKRPSLVVGIVVDGLSLDQIELLKEYFGTDGIRRLLNEGVTITDVDYGSVLDPTAATALIYTGASPSVSGIDAETIFDRDTRRTSLTLSDPSTIGNFTTETLSPRVMRVSTIGDELRIATGGLGHVYTISPAASQAIVMTGHNGNSGFWINDVNGKWATTTFYKDVPTAIQSRNHRESLDMRLDTMAWSNSMAVGKYPDMPSYKKLFNFRHSFQRNDPQRISKFKHTPLANGEVTDIAGEYLRSMNMGRGENIDMLNLSMTVSPYLYSNDPDVRMEQMDSYLRLDRQLAGLFKAIDTSGPGMNNTLVFITGTPAPAKRRKDDEKWDIAAGEFSPRRAIALLNMYLIARHGNGEWVIGFHNNQFFLNQNLITERDKNLQEMRRDAADFLSRMSGIAEAYTLDDVVAGKAVETTVVPRRNINTETAGDIFAAIMPGWDITDDGSANPQNGDYPVTQRLTAAVSPAFLLAPTLLQPQIITTPVDARVIAPTVSSILRIRSPNAAMLPPLRLARQ
ncbi:MAG: alkaline phosphatase family protein [Bacteroidales bacterium]|nr:alkaline phosphatase family protein [Bacteroidales bacterium]